MAPTTLPRWFALLFGFLPLLFQLLWKWNDLCCLASLKLRAALNKEYAGVKLAPGHMGLPLFGEMLSFLWYFKIVRRPDLFISLKKEKYGEGLGMYRTHLFGKPSIITCSIASNKLVFQSPGDFGIKWTAGGVLVGKNSMVNEGGMKHARLKTFVVRAINQPHALSRIAQVVQARLVVALRSWAEKRTIEACKEIRKVTFENTCKMFVSLEPGPLLDRVDKYFKGVAEGIRAMPLNFPGTAFHHGVQCRHKLEAIFREELERRKLENHDGADRDLMDGLMEIKDELGKKLTDEEVLDNTVSLVLGGYHSITIAETWALYLLAKSPEVLQKLREENQMVEKDKKGDLITLEEISRLKYTDKVVKEVIRMANISPFVFREAKRDVQYGDYIIPKGWLVIVWLRSIHIDPKNFEDPLNFNPERWSASEIPGSYQVFGMGNRICAGNMLARLQLTLLIHHLVLGYRWKLLNPDAEIRYLPHPCPEDNVVVAFQAI